MKTIIGNIDKIIEKTLEWHISSFNPKSIPIPFEWREKVDAWIRKMGYHFVINSVDMPDSVCDTLKLCVEIENVGVAPIYEKVPLTLRLFDGKNELKLDTGADVTAWLPGKHCVNVTIEIPKDLQRGEYEVSLGLVGDGFPEVYFASDAPRDGAFYRIGRIKLA